jgi:hypothetical protein
MTVASNRKRAGAVLNRDMGENLLRSHAKGTPVRDARVQTAWEDKQTVSQQSAPL